jgi:hypothetical protein
MDYSAICRDHILAAPDPLDSCEGTSSSRRMKRQRGGASPDNQLPVRSTPMGGRAPRGLAEHPALNDSLIDEAPEFGFSLGILEKQAK